MFKDFNKNSWELLGMCCRNRAQVWRTWRSAKRLNSQHDVDALVRLQNLTFIIQVICSYLWYIVCPFHGMVTCNSSYIPAILAQHCSAPVLPCWSHFHRTGFPIITGLNKMHPVNVSDFQHSLRRDPWWNQRKSRLNLHHLQLKYYSFRLHAILWFSVISIDLIAFEHYRCITCFPWNVSVFRRGSSAIKMVSLKASVINTAGDVEDNSWSFP